MLDLLDCVYVLFLCKRIFETAHDRSSIQMERLEKLARDKPPAFLFSILHHLFTVGSHTRGLLLLSLQSNDYTAALTLLQTKASSEQEFLEYLSVATRALIRNCTSDFTALLRRKLPIIRIPLTDIIYTVVSLELELSSVQMSQIFDCIVEMISLYIQDAQCSSWIVATTQLLFDHHIEHEESLSQLYLAFFSHRAPKHWDQLGDNIVLQRLCHDHSTTSASLLLRHLFRQQWETLITSLLVNDFHSTAKSALLCILNHSSVNSADKKKTLRKYLVRRIQDSLPASFLDPDLQIFQRLLFSTANEWLSFEDKIHAVMTLPLLFLNFVFSL